LSANYKSSVEKCDDHRMGSEDEMHKKRVDDAIESMICASVTNFKSLDEIKGFQGAKDEIVRSLLLPHEIPDAFLHVKNNNMFLLYGLPGIFFRKTIDGCQ